jgi:hypothetical protein
MTLLGKILVLANVALSFLMLSWALALFINRIDWTANKGKPPDQPAGQLVERQDRVKRSNDVLDLSNGRWREALWGNDGKDKRPIRDGLPAWEKRRVDDREWYALQLKAALTGPAGMGEKAVIKRVALTKEGQPVLDGANANRPTMVDAERRKDANDPKGEPLYCYNYYVAQLAKSTQDLEAAQLEYQKAVKTETELTEEAIGTKDKPKGLRQRIVDEQEKLKRINEELKDVSDRQTNSTVDTELLLARRVQLEGRVAELKKAAQSGKE